MVSPESQSVAIDRSSNLVTVTTNTEDLGVRHPLASMLPGIGDSTVVHSDGAAEWGVPVRGSTLALAIGYCEFADHPPQEGVASPTKILVEYNTDQSSSMPRRVRAWWVRLAPVDATARSRSTSRTRGSSASPATARQAPAAPTTYIASLLGKTIFIPIYDDFRGTGSNVEFHISEFAAFKVTGFKISGSNAYTDSGCTRTATDQLPRASGLLHEVRLGQRRFRTRQRQVRAPAPRSFG